MFVNFSRANHCCVGNCEHDFLSEHNLIFIVASCDVKAKEEILFRYVIAAESPEERKSRLNTGWGFVCDCRACNNADVEAQIELVKELDGCLYHHLKSGNVEECLHVGHRLIELCGGLGFISHRHYSRIYLLLFQAAITKKENYKIAVEFMKLAHQNILDHFGTEECDDVRKLNKFLLNVKSHPNYGLLDPNQGTIEMVIDTLGLGVTIGIILLGALLLTILLGRNG